jgi:hypothetical protein
MKAYSLDLSEKIVEAMDLAWGVVSAEDVRGFLAHLGYRTPARQLE